MQQAVIAPPRRDRVPSEYMGLARLFRQAVIADEAEMQTAIIRITLPVMRRLERKPSVRRTMELDVIRQWKQMPSKFRLAAEYGKDLKGCLEINETRLGAIDLRFAEWENWEPGVGLQHLSLTTNDRMKFNAEPFVILSLHAIARWFERSRQRDHHALVADILTLNDYNGSEERIATNHGTWIGDYQVVAKRDARQFNVRAIRTFVSNEGRRAPPRPPRTATVPRVMPQRSPIEHIYVDCPDTC